MIVFFLGQEFSKEVFFKDFILCYVMLCYVMLCYVMLCYVVMFMLERESERGRERTQENPKQALQCQCSVAQTHGP